jgi:hypothetical protein
MARAEGSGGGASGSGSSATPPKKDKDKPKERPPPEVKQMTEPVSMYRIAVILVEDTTAETFSRS